QAGAASERFRERWRGQPASNRGLYPAAPSFNVYSLCRETTAMGQTVGEYLLRRLREWGVRRVFGYPGDGINGIMGGFEKVGDEPRFVQVRHEEMAAFMACAHAKFTGEPGACLATSGPG